MVGKSNLLFRQTIDPSCDFFRLRPVVDEHERCPGRLDVSKNERRNRGPNAAADISEIRDGRLDGDHYLLCHAAVHDRDRPEGRLGRSFFAPTQKARDFVERPLRRRETDSLRSLLDQFVEPLQCKRQMGTALRSRDCMDLVDDHRTHAAEHAATFQRGEHDVQRFRCRDQNVRRLSEHSRPG